MLRTRAIGVTAALSVLATSTTACYSLRPVANVGVPLGSTVALDITDAGRLALGGSMGPEIGQIEGRLVDRNAAEYVLSVTGVRFLRGGEQVWNGERVSIKSDHVSTVRERYLSRGRTAILAGAAIGAVAFIVTRSITGNGQDIPGKTPGDTLGAIRIPRF